MKKIIAFFIILSLVIAPGCSKKEKQNTTDENKQQVKKIDVKAAKELMDNYMRYVMKTDSGAMKSFYSEKMKSTVQDIPPSAEPHPVGFKIEEGEGKKDKAEFKAHIYNAILGKAYYSDDTFKYTIITENNKMVIDKVEKEKAVEVYENKKDIYIREGDKAQGQPVVSLDDMPQFAVPKSASSPEQKFAVPREKFGPCGLSPDGKSITVTSMGVHTFLGIASIEESKETTSTQGDKKSGEKGGEEGQKEGGEEKKGEESKTEKMQNVTIKPVDLFFDGSVNIMSFSPDGKTLAVEFKPASGNNRINIYKNDSTELIDLRQQTDRFKADRFSMTSPYFVNENNLIFTVIPIKNATTEEQMLKGDWMLDIKNQKLTQIK